VAIFLSNAQHAIAQNRVLGSGQPLPLGGITDDILHLLDKNREHPAHGPDIGIVERQLVLDGLADAGQDLFGHVAAVAEHDALLHQQLAELVL